ncbi:MAG: TIM barrel protein [Acidobacteria bacterium]|nr:TIM barrel protein [Acidobacteriota bacterium]
MLSRRDLFAGAAALTAAACHDTAGTAATGASITRSMLISMLPPELPYEERFRMCVEIGFPAMEVQTVADSDEAQKIRAAAEKAGLRIHSVMNQAHWKFPLSSPDPAEVDASVAGMEASLEQAQLYGADTVLLVPAVVRDDTAYEQAWERSQAVIRERILPVAEKHEVVVAVEEVWNKFLLTARDFCQYIDEFRHPLVKAYFDVGNVVHYGVPQHWIRQIGDRLAKVHLKDYTRKDGFVNLGEGDVNWPEIRQALDAVGYQGNATVELKGGDRAYLDDVGKRVDRLLNLA